MFWYNPNKTYEFDCLEKCFENVEFCKGYNLISAINFFKNQSISEWIVVSPGSMGEELILNLENFQCIKTFFIYCWNTELHGWTNKRKKIGCVTSNPEILYQKFIELNKDYIISKFNYTSRENDEIYPKKLLDINSSFLKKIKKEKNIKKMIK